ncbi:hypothetical protein [Phytoactinopolyspora endophytica]|uniref:hypothetical protein n=1 Tax=Phytoactinopolyspora endophytica TaxID=1642495 RepID=UPI00197BAF31|nr:hypothetical protein [Phytoactinopolyspora endophytica]
MRRILVAITAAFVLVIGAVPAAHGAGHAPLPTATSALPLVGLCGSSYNHAGHYPIEASGTTIGYMDVYFSWHTRRNCLVTSHGGPAYGIRAYTEARIRPSGSSWPSCPSSPGCDGDFYSFYAGPVYTPMGVDMTGRCIDITAAVEWTSQAHSGVHCG